MRLVLMVPSRRVPPRNCALRSASANHMSDEIEFVESRNPAVCPHCGATLSKIEYRRQKLSFGIMRFAWVILLTCPQCHKLLATQSWG